MATVNLSSNASNGSATPHQLNVYNVHPRATWSAVVILIISVVGNSLLVAAFIRDRRLRVVFNTLVLTLAVADILLSLILMLEIITVSYHHPMFAESAILCRFVSIVVNAIPTEQLIISHMMCNDRHKALLRRLAYCQVRQQHNESLRLAVTWAFSLTSSFLITDIMIILDHGQFSLCFFPDRPLYVSKMAYIHSFLLILLVISLAYIVRDFRKQRNKKPYFVRLGSDIEPGLENYLDNRTSSQCLIPRSPVNIFRNNYVSLSPKAFHQFTPQDGKITSGDGKSTKVAPPLDMIAFDSGKTSPTEDKLVAKKDVLDWQTKNESDEKHKDERITQYANIGGEVTVVGNTHPGEEEERLEPTVNLKNVVRISRAEKRLMMRRGAILELNVENNDEIKSSDHVPKARDKLEVEASSNSQDEWSHSSCSFSEEEPTDIPMPRFKPRTDSMYTLRSCLSISEEATSFEPVNVEEYPVNSGDIIGVTDTKTENTNIQCMKQTDTEYTKNTKSVADTSRETCSQSGAVISGILGVKEPINLMKFDSVMECEPNPGSMNNRCPVIDFIQKSKIEDKEINVCMVRFSSAGTISIVHPNELSKFSEFTAQPTDCEIPGASQTQWDEDDKCNNYYGSECDPKSNNGLASGNNFSLTVIQKKQMSPLNSAVVEMPVINGHRIDSKNFEQVSPSDPTVDVDVAARDWINFYNVRRQSNECIGESLDSLPTDTPNSLTYSLNQRICHTNIRDNDITSTYTENKGSSSTNIMSLEKNDKHYPFNTECSSTKCQQVASNKVEGSGDNLSKSLMVKESLLRKPNVGDTMIGQSKLSSISVEDKITDSTEEGTFFHHTAIPKESAAPTPLGAMMSLSVDELESTAPQVNQQSKEKQLQVTDYNYDQHDPVCDPVFSNVHTDSMSFTGRNINLSENIQPMQEETIHPVNPVCTSDVVTSNEMFSMSVLDGHHSEEKNRPSQEAIDNGPISFDPFEMKSEQSEGRQLKDTLFTSPAVSDSSMSPLEFLDSLSVTRRAYLAEIGLYQDVLAGEVTLDASLLQVDQCPPCPYCLEKEKTHLDYDEPSDISSSEASSMTEFTLGDVDKLASRSLLSESRRKQLKFLADSSSNNLAPSEHLRSSYRSFYLRRSSESPSWCEMSPECPVFTTDISDHFNFRHRNKVYNRWSPPFKKVKKFLSFEIIKSYDPELSILISLLLLTLVQLICWLPITSLYVYFNFHNFPHILEVQEIHYILLWLVRMAIQPFIYIYYSKCFRMNFVYFLSCGFYNYRK
ncbi:hypothetical protein Btru_004045 [Bulinus truncatus]|nr:hypothetical protein Btru_004045 [Bulinus truncatus]